MNEVTKIHLGRQAYTISVDAHRELRDYLNTIKKYVHDDGVVAEVELRMAELLSEHGVHGDQVVLPADVTFLREQLGNPEDFADVNESGEEADRPAEGKRLYRDTDNAMIAGVAAGIANYFSIDVLLVRLLFVIATFAGGWGILIYLVLWILVPEAKTPSDRLHMAGKAVTIEGLKEIVERADVKGAARRANNSLVGPINTGFKVLLKIIGVGFVLIGLCVLLALTGFAIYTFLHNSGSAPLTVFPIGFKEHLLVYIGIGVLGILALFIVLFGIAMYQRKWPIHVWITGTLVGLAFIGFATGSALAADVIPQVRNQYNANVHSTSHAVKPFTQINTDNLDGGINVVTEQSNAYSVRYQYFDHPDLSTIQATVSHGTLYLSSPNYNNNRNCQTLCFPQQYNMTITVYAPVSPNFVDSSVPDAPSPPDVTSVPMKPVSQ